jgi:hypothetical protein
MSVCSHCYERFSHNKGIEVGHWWNNSPYLAVVCSETCKDKLKKLVDDNTWMLRKVTQNWANSEAEIRQGGPSALTDKQFKME